MNITFSPSSSVVAIASTAATKEVELKVDEADADLARSHAQGGGDSRSGVQTLQSPARRGRVEKERVQRGEYDGHGGEGQHFRASRKQEGASEGDKPVDEAGAPPQERRAEESENQAKEEGQRLPQKAEAAKPAIGPPSERAPSTFQGSKSLGSLESSTFRDPPESPADHESSRKGRVSSDAQTGIPLFGDVQQFNLPRLVATQFPGFTVRSTVLGRSDASKQREADDSSVPQYLFDFPGSTIPFLPFVEFPRAGEGAGAAPLVHWLPGVGGDLKLPGWPDFGSGGLLKNVTSALPGFGNLGGLPFGTTAEIPAFPTLSDLLQDPLNVDQLQILLKEALTQIQESPLNTEKFKDILYEIVRRVTPQEAFLVKHLVRGHKEGDATRARKLAEAILEAASRVGHQLKILKEVSVAGTMGPGGDVSASESSFTLLGDMKEVLAIEEAFTRFRVILEQLLAPLVNVMPAFSPSNWGVPTWT